jgi:hypothetical protein
MGLFAAANHGQTVGHDWLTTNSVTAGHLTAVPGQQAIQLQQFARTLTCMPCRS